MNLGDFQIDDVLTFPVQTQRFDTGAAADADSAPTYRVYEDETATPILTGTMALLDSSNTDGFYSEQITLSAANGFESGKTYTIRIAATVNAVAGATTRVFRVKPAPATAAAVAALNNISAADVWSYATRILTAGTNIVLAKGTGVTGFNDLSAAQVNAEADAALADVGLTATVTGRIDAAVSTRMASFSYTAPDNDSIALIKAKTDNLPSDPADHSVVIAATDAILSAVNNIPTASQNAAAVLTTQMTESYAADGVAPTLSQAVLLTQQALTEFGINSTTITVKKLDGATTAATFTLDDAAAPTSRTRAT